MNEQAASTPLAEVLTADDTCPRCLGELDTGWECNDCDFDAMKYADPE